MVGRLFKTVVPIVMLAAAAFGGYMLWQTRPEVAAKPARELSRTVAAVTVEYRDIRPSMRLYGAIVAGREVDLRPLVAGRIVEIGESFADGGILRAGDLIIAIDPFDVQADAAEFRARVAEAVARLDEIAADLVAAGRLLDHDREQTELARRDVERRERLQGTAASSVKSLDDARLALSQRRQQVIERELMIDRLAAQADQQQAVHDRWRVFLSRAKRDLTETRLTAPFDGYLVDTDAGIGKRVGLGDRIARLIDAGRLEARFHLSNSEYARLLAAGDDDGYRGRAAEVVWRIGDAAFGFKAVIDRVDGEIDAQSGGVDLYARILGHGADGVLRPGAFVEVSLDDRLYRDVVRLPESALHEDGAGGERVYVVVDNRLEARAVEVLLRDGGDILLRGSLVDDERVVVTRLPEIGPGLLVSVR
ncbi:MAG: efflux RND transporter periplasmic adaptor subunit [Proteobacteria bacterium]|nr:efflux RND transporter periplasmic adaptor subunit [Pseudomonadota bacterium]